jgi:tRNA-dihydrouridine synthase A
MLGRAAYHDPSLLLRVDSQIFGAEGPVRSADAAAREFRPWMSRRLHDGMPLHAITRHMLGLFAGRAGARQWRRILSERAPGARGEQAIAIYDEALAAVRPRETADVS